MRRPPLWAGVLVNGLIGLVAIVALIIVLATGARLTHVERTITTIHREVVHIEEVVPGTNPHGRPGPAPAALLAAPALPPYFPIVSLPDLSRPAGAQAQEVDVVLPPDQFAGVWANAAQAQRTPHEITLDFIRVGPQGQQAMIVSRVNISPLLLDQLLTILSEQQAPTT